MSGNNPVTVTGYASTLSFFATRYKQGDRTTYSLDLSLDQLTSLVPMPDPTKPNPGNRAIRPAHADAFAKYLRQRTNWVAPGILLRTSQPFDFDVMQDVAGAQFGVLSFPRRRATDLHIVDGQHRILGVFRAQQSIADDLDRARSNLANVRRTDAGGAGEREARARIADLEKQLERLEQERINVQILVESDETKYRQIFFDIADNALGITASVRSRFDSTKVVNRAYPLVVDHPLLVGRVDIESDRLGRGSVNLLAAKHIAEIIRTVNVGLDGRVSRRQEESFKEKDLAARSKEFFTVLQEAFPPLQAVALGQVTTDTLRRSSLLGSVLMLRVLGGVYYDLLTEHHFNHDDVKRYFQKLAPHMSGPAYEGDIWTTHVPEIYQPGSFGPRGRRQDLKGLKDALVAWAVDREKFLDEAPAPRPAPKEDEVDPEYGAGYTSLGFDIPS